MRSRGNSKQVGGRENAPSSSDLFAAELKRIDAKGSPLAWAYFIHAAQEGSAISADDIYALMTVTHHVRKPRPGSHNLVVRCGGSSGYERCKDLYPKLANFAARLTPPRRLRVEIDGSGKRAALKAFDRDFEGHLERVRWDVLKGSESASKGIAAAGFLHSYLAQVGLPRSAASIPRRPDGSRDLHYVVNHGRLVFSVSAGMLHDKPLPLPYGPKPRLMLFDICSQAVRTKSRKVDLGRSAREYLGMRLGIGWGGGAAGPVTLFRNQAQALAGCSMRFSWTEGERVLQYQGMPVEEFAAWSDDGRQAGLWPGELTLSEKFLESLLQHALPLERDAYFGLKSHALAMDVYAFLAYYLPSKGLRQSQVWSWERLHAALGHGQSVKEFKRSMLGGRSRGALGMALDAYPAARVMGAVEVLADGSGVRFRHAAPAIRRVAIPGA